MKKRTPRAGSRREAFIGCRYELIDVGVADILLAARPEGFSGGTLLGCGRLRHRPGLSLAEQFRVLGELTLLLPGRLGKARFHNPRGLADSRQARVNTLKIKGYLVMTMMSTRRLRARPAAVSSLAIGDDSPRPED